MTTIATDGRVMAGDGRCADDDGMICSEKFLKVFKISEGPLVGFAGAPESCHEFLEWIGNGGAENPENISPEFKRRFVGLVVDRNGETLLYDNCLVPVKVDAPFAIGSGAKYAVGAMKAGLSPQDAVAVAMRCDIQTGGHIVLVGRDSDRSGEAGETPQSGSTEGESAGRKASPK